MSVFLDYLREAFPRVHRREKVGRKSDLRDKRHENITGTKGLVRRACCLAVESRLAD